MIKPEEILSCLFLFQFLSFIEDQLFKVHHVEIHKGKTEIKNIHLNRLPEQLFLLLQNPPADIFQILHALLVLQHPVQAGQTKGLLILPQTLIHPRQHMEIAEHAEGGHELVAPGKFPENIQKPRCGLIPVRPHPVVRNPLYPAVFHTAVRFKALLAKRFQTLRILFHTLIHHLISSSLLQTVSTSCFLPKSEGRGRPCFPFQQLYHIIYFRPLKTHKNPPHAQIILFSCGACPDRRFSSRLIVQRRQDRKDPSGHLADSHNCSDHIHLSPLLICKNINDCFHGACDVFHKLQNFFRIHTLTSIRR